MLTLEHDLVSRFSISKWEKAGGILNILFKTDLKNIDLDDASHFYNPVHNIWEFSKIFTHTSKAEHDIQFKTFYMQIASRVAQQHKT